MTPLYAFVIFFSATWYTRLGDGPVWKQMTEIEYTFCRRNWWTNLLYINNYINYDNACMQYTWFLAVDFHLIIIAAIFFALILKYPKSVLYIFGSSFVYSVVVLAVTIYMKNMDAGLILWPEFLKHVAINTNEYFYFHIATHTNVGNFTIGLIFGYAYFKLRKANIDLHNSKVIILFI